MVIETARLPALKAISVAARELLVDEHLQAEQVAEGRHRAGHAAGQGQELVGRREPEPPGPEHRAEPRVVDPPVGGEDEVHRTVVGADHERLGAASSGVPRTAAASALVRTGACSSTWNGTPAAAEPCDETLGEGGARVRVFDHRATGAGWSSDRRARAGRAGGPDRRRRPGAGSREGHGARVCRPARAGRPGSRGAVPGPSTVIHSIDSIFSGSEAHRIPVGLPDFKSGVGF